MNNKKKFFYFGIFSFIFISVLGTLLHFTFKWSNYNMFVGVFSAVNESTWEHLKLIFFPSLITTIIGYFYFGKDISTFLCSRIVGIITALLFTVIFFYTSSGIIGTNIGFLNIATFFITVFIGEFITYYLLISNFNCNSFIATFIFVILFFAFVFFTYFPPNIGLFEDPISGQYGIFSFT